MYNHVYSKASTQVPYLVNEGTVMTCLTRLCITISSHFSWFQCVQPVGTILYSVNSSQNFALIVHYWSRILYGRANETIQ